MGVSTEHISKSASRVLDAAKIRAEYKQKKRARMEGGVDDANDHDGHMGGASKPPPPPPPHKKHRMDARAGAGAEKSRVLTKTKGKEHHHLLDTQASIEIQPGESLKHFNQ